MEGSFPLTVTLPLLSLPILRGSVPSKKRTFPVGVGPVPAANTRYAEADHRSGGGVEGEERTTVGVSFAIVPEYSGIAPQQFANLNCCLAHLLPGPSSNPCPLAHFCLLDTFRECRKCFRRITPINGVLIQILHLSGNDSIFVAVRNLGLR